MRERGNILSLDEIREAVTAVAEGNGAIRAILFGS
jgi:hypothetical protein